MHAYYASRLSPNISRTSEGYLICLNVPIARIGAQEYLGEELGMEEQRGKMVTVYREESEVFDPIAMASFEGKPTTDDHPGTEVRADNVAHTLKGVVSNVRRGQNGDSDKVLADLIIYDPVLIDKIMNGKRDVSCGYECWYEVGKDGKIRQREIRGNHVAVVQSGRARTEVSIHDAAPASSPAPPAIAVQHPTSTSAPTRRAYFNFERRNPMNKPNAKSSLISKLFPMLTQDADSDVVAEVMEALVEPSAPASADTQPPDEPAKPQDNKPPEPPAATDNEMPPWAKALSDQLEKLMEQIAASKAADSDSLEQLEKELSGGKSGEAAVTIPVQEMDENGMTDSDENASQVLEDEEAEAKPSQDQQPPSSATADSRQRVLSYIRTIKPEIAKIKDPAQRKKVSDSIAAMARMGLGTHGNPAAKGAYAGCIFLRASCRSMSRQSALNRWS